MNLSCLDAPAVGSNQKAVLLMGEEQELCAIFYPDDGEFDELEIQELAAAQLRSEEDRLQVYGPTGLIESWHTYRRGNVTFVEVLEDAQR